MQCRKEHRTEARREAFIRMLRDGTSIADAAKAIGCGRRNCYDWRDDDPSFRRAWDDAVDTSFEAIESVLYRKVIGGDLLAVIFFFEKPSPRIYNQKQILTVEGGDTPIAAVMDHLHRGDRVQFYVPSNHRDEPDADDKPLTIDGKAEEAA